MSSPKVLTFKTVPHEVALASNRDDIAHYLEMAREIYDAAVVLQAETLSRGGNPPAAPAMPFAAAEAAAWAKYRADPNAGVAGMKFAHAYWQSLKHPWQDQVIERFSQATAAEAERLAQENKQVVEIARAVVFEFRGGAEVTRQTVDLTGVGPSLDWNVRLAGVVEAILRATPPERLVVERERILAFQASDPHSTWLALEAERLAVEQNVKQRVQAEVARISRETMIQGLTERATRRLKRCEVQIDQMESTLALELAACVEALHTEVAEQPDAQGLEDRIEQAEQAVVQAIRGQSLLEAAIAALRVQGYETVQVMDVAGPEDVRSVFVEDKKDAGRVALIQVSESRSLVSAEVVRRTAADGSSTEKLKDREAQARLCQAMDAAEAALQEQWQFSVVGNAAPGSIAPKVKMDIPQHTKRTADTRRSQRMRVGAS